MTKNNKEKHCRKAWFRVLKKIMRLFVKECMFVYLGEAIKDRGIILSNYVGTSASLAFDYIDQKI